MAIRRSLSSLGPSLRKERNLGPKENDRPHGHRNPFKESLNQRSSSKEKSRDRWAPVQQFSSHHLLLKEKRRNQQMVNEKKTMDSLKVIWAFPFFFSFIIRLLISWLNRRKNKEMPADNRMNENKERMISPDPFISYRRSLDYKGFHLPSCY